jgi:AAA family ATP:ADP antiporter
MAIPGVLAIVDSPKSVDILLRNLEQRHGGLLHEIIRSLNKLRTKYSSLVFDRTIVRNAILRKVTFFYRLLLIHAVLRETPEIQPAGGEKTRRAGALLIKALDEKLDFTVDEIFRLLGLRYDPLDMYNTYLGITSGRPALHANAVEFLDNVLEPGLKAVVIPIVERSRDEILSLQIHRRLDLERPSYDESIHYLLRGDDGWLKSAALYLIAESGGRRFSDAVSVLVRDEDVIVKETARYCTGIINNLS